MANKRISMALLLSTYKKSVGMAVSNLFASGMLPMLRKTKGGDGCSVNVYYYLASHP